MVMTRRIVLTMDYARNSFPASSNGPVMLAKWTDPPTVIVLASLLMETVLKWLRSISIPFWTVPRVAE